MFKILMDARLRLGVLLALLLLLAYELSILFWQLYPQPAMSDRPSLVLQSAGDGDTVVQQSYASQADAIARAYLFGKAEVKQARVEVTEQAPETQLKYKLRGIYYSEEATLSSAIVEIRPNKSQHFRVEDELEDKIILAAIASDHILINRYGKIERLNLQKPTVSSAGASRQRQVSRNPNATTRLLKSYKRRYVSNPIALANRFQAIPVQENGRNIGFRLKALRGESLLRKLDFQENDVFTKVNGISLDKPFEALDALKSLTTAEDVSVTIMRDGSEQTLDFNL